MLFAEISSELFGVKSLELGKYRHHRAMRGKLGDVAGFALKPRTRRLRRKNIAACVCENLSTAGVLAHFGIYVRNPCHLRKNKRHATKPAFVLLHGNDINANGK